MTTYSTDSATEDLVIDAPQLTAADRCDACGAQAYVRVTVNGTELLFCAHHAKRHQEKLEAIASEWHDETNRLLEDSRA